MKIGLLGHGVVGSGVRRIIDAGNTAETAALEVTRILVRDEAEVTDARMTLHAEDILNDPEIDIVCECMGGLEPAHTFVKTALENGKHAVTSNKKMLATFAEELFAIAKEHNVHLQYEASVGGGIPWIHELAHIRRVDEITSFEGIFNGTTNYILSRMTSEAKDFAPMLEEAQALGYAERDPSDDIDGFDVRYKVALSSLSAFSCAVKPEDVPVFGIRNITKRDIDWGKENGLAVKLIGRGRDEGDFLSLGVTPVFMKSTEVFASVPLNFNAIESDSPTLGKAVFTGQGAGSLPTAHAVVQDLIDLARGQAPESAELSVKPVSSAAFRGVFYVRTKKMGLLANLVAERVAEDAFLTAEVSLADLAISLKSVDDETAFVAEVRR